MNTVRHTYIIHDNAVERNVSYRKPHGWIDVGMTDPVALDPDDLSNPWWVVEVDLMEIPGKPPSVLSEEA